MSARYLVAAAVLVAGGICMGADKKDDKDKLQGEWVVESFSIDGEKMPAVKGMKLAVKGDVLTHLGFPARSLDEFKFSIRVDATKSPKHLDLEFKEEVSWGIYKLEGDTLTYCRAKNEGERPAEFKGGRGVVLFVCKRAGK